MPELEPVWTGATWRDYTRPAQRPQERSDPWEGQTPVETVFGAVGTDWEDARAIIERVGKAGSTVRPLLARLLASGRVERCILRPAQRDRGRQPFWYRRTPAQESLPHA